MTPMREARIARGLMLKDAAAQAGVDSGALSRFERGLEHVSIGALYRLAQVIGLEGLERELAPYVIERKP
ncbi:helix-turn-helix domain-containing protein [Streptomyces hydrogenans]|uniref:helix-turn-helix domain-containing protein n=1 Tax=Streptomyces hydrogenans TaxID=1873719 RepID=UPI003827A759